MPEKIILVSDFLYKATAVVLTGFVSLLTIRVFNFPREYVMKIDSEKMHKENREDMIRFEKKMEKGFERIHERIDKAKEKERKNQR